MIGGFTMSRLLRVLLCALVVVIGPGVPCAVSAAPVVTFTVDGGFTGIVNLPSYPCSSLCTGMTMSNGYFAGQATVFDANQRPLYEAQWPGDTAPNLTLNNTPGYTEDCGILVPIGGTASGGFVISGGVMTQGAMVVGTATLQGTFAWLRTETVATISTENVSLLLNGSVVASAVVGGAGVATMSPPIQSVSTLPLPPSCSHEVPVQVVVVGAYAQAA
jgi:hypothetical protein